MSDDSNNVDGLVDFDFLMGSWKTHNRRLRERLAGSTSWEEFEGRVTARKILGGLGNCDEVVMQRESGTMEGMTLRFYDAKSGEWNLHWADSVRGMTFPPQVGKFQNGRGEFYAFETHADKHIFSRFIWSDITENSCRWEQAFSEDGGKTWETNWTMAFTRLS